VLSMQRLKSVCVRVTVQEAQNGFILTTSSHLSLPTVRPLGETTVYLNLGDLIRELVEFIETELKEETEEKACAKGERLT